MSNFEQDVSLKHLNSWRIGGEARFYAQPENAKEVEQLLKQFDTVIWLGLGSNVLIRDQGIDGLVIHTKKLSALSFEDGKVYAQAGVTCAKLARFCCKHDMLGAEFFAGIPGTVGGALRMNAGAFGGQTWEAIKAVETINALGVRHQRTVDDFEIGYRTVKNLRDPQEGFLSACIELPIREGQGQEALAKIKQLLQQRNESQPIGTYNCGSVFRNPTGDYAARLIEECDLKGYSVGEAIISKKHANFIINSGNASSEDVEQLIQCIQKTVKDRFGIKLEPEVKIIGQTRSVY